MTDKKEQSVSPIEVTLEDGTTELYWIAGVINYEGYEYGLLTPVIRDSNGQIVNQGEEVDDGIHRVALLVKYLPEEGDDRTLEEIDPDSELGEIIIQKLRDEGYIAFEEDDEAEAELDRIAVESLKKGNKEMHEKYEKALKEVSDKLNK